MRGINADIEALLERFHPEARPELARALLGKHMGSMAQSVEEYKVARRTSLGRKVMAQPRIYLDTNHWIGIRDHHLGKSDEPRYGELAEVLQDLVESDRVVIPLTDHLSDELFRQSDSGTRNAMAEAMDRLCRVGILSFRPRQILEVRHWLDSLAVSTPLPLALQVWTYVAYIYGELPVALLGNPVAVQAAEKAVDDLAQHLSFAQLVSQIEVGEPEATWRRWAEELSEKKANEWKDDEDFEEIFIEESLGYWELLWDGLFAELGTAFRRLPTGGNPTDSELRANTKKVVAASIQRDVLRTSLPGMQIVAGGNARIRQEEGRRFKPGDGPDFFHAAAALPYCTVFVTDGSLRHLVSTPPTEFSARFDCKVFSDLTDVLACLEEIGT